MAHLSATVFMPLVTMGVGIEILDGREPVLPQRNIRCASLAFMENSFVRAEGEKAERVADILIVKG